MLLRVNLDRIVSLFMGTRRSFFKIGAADFVNVDWEMLIDYECYPNRAEAFFSAEDGS